MASTRRLFATAAAAAGASLAFARSAGAAQERHQDAPDPASMVAELAALGPHPSLGDHARAFDHLVGTWDCAYTFHLPDGGVRRASGELRFGWILDGRAMQDIWITYPADSGGERRIGTSIRFLDGNTGLWRVVFVSPAFDAMVTVEGGVEEDRIVLRGRDPEGAAIRWSFNDIGADSFSWRGETSRDEGATWVLEEEHRMTRRRRA